jgi:hypothetical protein
MEEQTRDGVQSSLDGVGYETESWIFHGRHLGHLIDPWIFHGGPGLALKGVHGSLTTVDNDGLGTLDDFPWMTPATFQRTVRWILIVFSSYCLVG